MKKKKKILIWKEAPKNIWKLRLQRPKNLSMYIYWSETLPPVIKW